MGRNLHENGQTALQTWQREPRAQIDEHEWLSFLVEWHAHEILAHLACSIPAVLIRIPCIFNVLKANQLFLFHSALHSFTFSRFICSMRNTKPFFFSAAVRAAHENSFQIRVVFLYWLPCLLRMSRPGQESYECAPIPIGGNSSEKTKQMNDVELRERWVDSTVPLCIISRLSFHSKFNCFQSIFSPLSLGHLPSVPCTKNLTSRRKRFSCRSFRSRHGNECESQRWK